MPDTIPLLDLDSENDPFLQVYSITLLNFKLFYSFVLWISFLIVILSGNNYVS
jgi:hypothetical protein